MHNKRILVTGGSGFIGANLVRRLVEEGYKPIILIRKESNLWRIKDLLNKVTILETDLLDYKKLEKNLKQIKPQIIYHLAVYGAYQGKQKDINSLFDINIIGTVNLLTVCCLMGFDYFINTGSSSEYGIKNYPMKENDFLQPTNLYGMTKASATLASYVFSLKHKLPIVTLRLFNPYGYYEEKIRLIPSLILAALSNQMVKLSHPDYVRDFIFIDDLLDPYLYFLEGKKYYGDIINIGSGQQTSIVETVRITESVLKRKLNIAWATHLSNQLEPKMWQADISKAKKLLNWKPKITLIEGLSKTVSWFKENINLYSI